ncbi:hypothetical protein F4604DRAFT_1751264 [Suillus subluteus]|nr:hypothetical protein F4604DRAFT_1751264 [Suillus subluteus]
MLPMVLGEYIYVIGFGFRFALHYNPDSVARGIYIAEYLMIVLSVSQRQTATMVVCLYFINPCFFVATNYVLLGRLAREIDCVHRVLIPVRRLTLNFVLSDVTTLSFRRQELQ